MARQAREKSSTGIYHIMLRGIDKRDIFLDNEDKKKFIKKLVKAKERANFELYGYCLMDNHVHLLIKENEDIGNSIRRMTVGYVRWHNNKYAREGHLFGNRFASEPVETDSYLIGVLRYIHQNPVKAKIVKQPKDYVWSSYFLYIDAYEGKTSYIDTRLIKEYFKTREDFERYMSVPSHDDYMDYKPVRKYTDSALREILQKQIDFNKLTLLPIQERNKIIKDVYHRTGTSIRQLGRVLGLGKTIIEKAVREDA